MGDEELRGRLSALADEGSPRLDEAARERVLDRVEQEGPAVVAQTRWGRIAGFGLALAAAAALVFFLATAERPEAPVAETPPGAACEGWSAAVATPRDGLVRLGRRGEARFDGELALSAPDGCTTELELAAGSVTVRADDLGEGTLRVAAGDVVVEVRGTRFTVIREAAHVAVDVAEGHVVVRAPGEREIHLHTGERWSRGDGAASAEPAEGGAEAQALAAEAVRIDEPDPPRRSSAAHAPRPEEREPLSDSARLIEAGRIWHAGERERARAIFREVGAGRGSTAEAAWLALARLELNAGELRNASELLSTQRRRFPRSRMGPEVLWRQADVARRMGDAAGRSRALAELRERYPDSAQAASASNLEEAETP